MLKKEAMDAQGFPKQVLESLAISVPDSVNTWGKLIQHIELNSAVLPQGLLDRCLALQNPWSQAHSELITRVLDEMLEKNSEKLREAYTAQSLNISGAGLRRSEDEVLPLAERMYGQATEDQKKQILTLFSNLPGQQRQEMQAQGYDPVKRYFYQRAQESLTKQRQQNLWTAMGATRADYFQHSYPQAGKSNFDFSSIMGQQANAVMSQESGDEVVPASNNQSSEAWATPQSNIIQNPVWQSDQPGDTMSQQFAAMQDALNQSKEADVHKTIMEQTREQRAKYLNDYWSQPRQLPTAWPTMNSQSSPGGGQHSETSPSQLLQHQPQQASDSSDVSHEGIGWDERLLPQPKLWTDPHTRAMMNTREAQSRMQSAAHKGGKTYADILRDPPPLAPIGNTNQQAESDDNVGPDSIGPWELSRYGFDNGESLVLPPAKRTPSPPSPPGPRLYSPEPAPSPPDFSFSWMTDPANGPRGDLSQPPAALKLGHYATTSPTNTSTSGHFDFSDVAKEPTRFTIMPQPKKRG